MMPLIEHNNKETSPPTLCTVTHISKRELYQECAKKSCTCQDVYKYNYAGRLSLATEVE